MKISNIHANYVDKYIKRKDHNTKNSTITPALAERIPYFSNAPASYVSFGSRKYVLEQNQHIDKIKTRLYIGKKGSTADKVEAENVVLEDRAKINRLNLKFHSFWSTNLPDKYKKYNGHYNVVLHDNAKIERIEDYGNDVSIAYINKTAMPQQPSIDCDSSDLHETAIHETDKNIGNLAESFMSSTKLYGKTEANKINSYYAYLHDNTKIQSIIAQRIHLQNNSSCDKIEPFTSYKGRADFKENYYSRVYLSDNAMCNNIKIEVAHLSGKSSAKNISAEIIELCDDAKVENIIVKDKLKICDNSSVGNITVTGDKPEVILSGNAQITGKIVFENNQGTVKIQKNDKSESPTIKPEQIINGKLQKDYKPIGFERVAGMSELKESLKIDVIEPLNHSEKYAKYNLKPVNGILFYGPPRCGKTFIANALAEELGRHFEYLDGSKINSKWGGIGTQVINQAFENAINKAPSILFIDEADSVAPQRENMGTSGYELDVKTQISALLTRLNNLGQKKVLVVFATNEPQNIDNAIKRTGRLDKKIYISPPDKEARLEMLKMYLKNRYIEDNIDYDTIVQKTQNYASSDIAAIVEQAVRNAAREDVKVSTKHFENALKQIEPSLDEYTIEKYKSKGKIA